MSLKLNERYPGRFNNPSNGYPQGSFKNRTTPTSKDGSYLEKDWANDKEGFFQSLLSKSGYIANGLVDKVGSSQYYDALVQTIKDKAEVAWAKVTGKPTTLSGYGITDAYTITQADSKINARILRDSITAAGLANNDPSFPFMLRESDGKPYFLQPRLGYSPLQQGGGIGQSSNKVMIGWSHQGLKAQVDNLDLGVLWSSYTFNPDSKADKAATDNALGQCIKLGQSVPAQSNPKFGSNESGPIANLSTGSGTLEINNGGVANASAVMTFNRLGAFATYLGVDTDNQLKVGGWSMGNVAHTLWHSGNCDMTGAIVHFPRSEPPAGFLRANGAAVRRSSYPALFARIGTTHGAGDGSTTFNLPDWRGVFVRGLDEGRSLDPGRALNSFQYDQLQGHAQSAPPGASGFTVYAPGQGGASAGEGINIAPNTGGVVSDGVNGNPRVGAETRPVNIAFLACIKY